MYPDTFFFHIQGEMMGVCMYPETINICMIPVTMGVCMYSDISAMIRAYRALKKKGGGSLM